MDNDVLFVRGSDGVCYLEHTDIPLGVRPLSVHYNSGIVEFLDQQQEAASDSDSDSDNENYGWGMEGSDSEDDDDDDYYEGSDSEDDDDDKGEVVHVAPHHMAAVVRIVQQ